MPFALPRLPFAPSTLSALSSSETFELHHGHHHRKYVDQVNTLARGTRFERCPLMETIALEAEGELRLNASQAWNHELFWRSLAAVPQPPSEDFGDAVRACFGSVEGLVRQLREAADARFGPGWAWLVRAPDGNLRVVTTEVAENPARDRLAPLLAVDLWEHAYYLDYRDERARFVERAAEHLDWAEAGRRFGAPLAASGPRFPGLTAQREGQPRLRSAAEPG